MNRIAVILLAASFSLMGSGVAMAHNSLATSGLGAATHYPGAPRPVTDTSTPRPYPMNYTDEAAQNLGVHNGRVEIFSNDSRGDGLAPAITGGVDGGGAMVKLQWHPGG